MGAMQTLSGSDMREAMLYEKQDGGRVLCKLCAHECVIDAEQRGICQVRQNIGGKLHTLVYNQLVAQNANPVEKKPLYHFHPGSTLYSIATQGCNFRCQYCTNWEVSQASETSLRGSGRGVTPEEVVASAAAARCGGIAYTYVEPTIFFEYFYDVARLASAAGLKNVLKTNGFMTRAALELCRPYVDAANVDLKTFNDVTYRRFGGRLEPVLESLKLMKAFGIWLEVTTLVIPGVNDSDAELGAVAGFICRELGASTPWHVLRFFPSYKMTGINPTHVESLHRAREIGRGEGLRYIYFSNIIEQGGQDTSCHECGHVLVERQNSKLLRNSLQDGCCPNCAAQLPGLFK
ncbi:MAG: AmmeMemoRadiSam system radical SAM enzyme [Pyrinomonadaceae bacterium]